jgi:hypothetical protein
MNRQMNQMSGGQGPSFTPKQGQYLAFIDADGTSVSGYSDVDYFAVIPAGRLQENSDASLAQIQAVLQRRFPNTRVCASIAQLLWFLLE